MKARTYGELVDAGTPLATVYQRVVDLHQALKAAPVKERVWTYAWTHNGREFVLKLNGYLKRTVDDIGPLQLMVEANGWPAILCDMFHGAVIGGGETEAMVLQALDAEIAKARA